jgi:hypothetical protein
MKQKEEFPIIAAYIEARIEKTKSIFLGVILALPSIFAIIYSI